LQEAIEQADLFFVSIDTPTKARGLGAGYSLNIDRLEDIITSISRYTTSNKIIVEKSTVPVGTGKTIQQLLNNHTRPGVHFEVFPNPEFLAEGTAI
jgi:UDPglucose 6-dehydrogenase